MERKGLGHKFQSIEPGATVWIGVDVHKRSYHVAIRLSDGWTDTWVCSANPKGLVDQIKEMKVKVALIVYEAGPTGFNLARVVQAEGMPVCVVAPSKVLREARRGAKTDRLDCIRLAEYGAMGLAKPIAIPSENEEAHRTLIRRRHQVVDGTRRIKQRIKSFLLNLGIQEPQGLTRWGRRAVSELMDIEIHPTARVTLDSLLRELKYHHEELQSIDSRLEELAKMEEHRESIEQLRTVPGVGPVIALSYKLEMFRPERFNRAEEVASYLGLAPTVAQSGEAKARGRIHPTGQTRLRSLLIEAAWMWKSKDPGAQQWYGSVLARCGVAQKAITALARKLSVILWRISVDHRPYRPLATKV